MEAVLNPEQFRELVLATRSTRRFNGQKQVALDTLRQLIDLARQTSSSRNRQPLKYILINGNHGRAEVFSCLNWAKALDKWGGPSEQERPAAYVIILGDTTISDNFSADPGISSQTIMLAARTFGLGGCILASADRDMLRAKFQIPAHLEIVLTLALGEPAEEIQLETMSDGETRPYWRDEQDVHHVPKRPLAEVTFGEFTD